MTRKWISLVLTISFGWIFIGALVNFHQVHVWSKDLPESHWTFVKPKSCDRQHQVDLDKLVREIDSYDVFCAENISSGHGFFACSPCSLLRVLHRDLIAPSDLVYTPGLRAPPAA